jgi:uncharacterized membrane protein
MHPDYVWWGPMWVFPMVMPIIMLVVLLLCLYFIFGRGGSGRPGIMLTGIIAPAENRNRP